MIRSLSRSFQGLKLYNFSPVVAQKEVLIIEKSKSQKWSEESRNNKVDLLFTPKSIQIVQNIQPLPIIAPSLNDFEDTMNKVPNIEDILFPPNSEEEIQAARLIVIRRKKMKKHQRRKLYKRMKYKWAKLKINRKIRKEKVFQAELVAMVKEAESFSAESYVKEMLEQANYQPLPTHWKGRRLPEFIIRQLMGLDKKINYKHTDNYKA